MKKGTILASTAIVAASVLVSESNAYRNNSFMSTMKTEKRETSHPGHVHLTAVRDEKSNVDCLKGCNAVHVPDFFVDRVAKSEQNQWLNCVKQCQKGPVKGNEYYEIPVALRSHEDVQKIVLKETSQDKFEAELAKISVENLKKRARILKKRLMAKLSLS